MGKCVARRRLAPIDGEWGEWVPYGDCSRTCGGGVKKSIRFVIRQSGLVCLCGHQACCHDYVLAYFFFQSVRNLSFYEIRRLIERVHDLYVHVACIVYHLA